MEATKAQTMIKDMEAKTTTKAMKATKAQTMIKDMKAKTTTKDMEATKAQTTTKDMKATKAQTKVKDMKAKKATKAKPARELDSEEHLSDDHFADDDFVDASDSQPESVAEKDEKKVKKEGSRMAGQTGDFPSSCSIGGGFVPNLRPPYQPWLVAALVSRPPLIAPIHGSSPQAEAKKKCDSEEHVEEMRVRHREYELDTEIERLIAEYTPPSTPPSSGKERQQLQPLPQPADNEPAPV
jgi:hypothetical protein